MSSHGRCIDNAVYISKRIRTLFETDVYVSKKVHENIANTIFNVM